MADLPSSTLEEAPAELKPWMRQRSRWLKGFLQTAITHALRPSFALARLGALGFFAASLMMAGTVVSALVYPFAAVATIVALASGARARIGPPLDAYGWGIGLTVFARGFAAMVLPAVEALRRRRWWGLLPWVPVLPFYYVLVSVAAWRALVELFHAPFRWHKTEHGLARTSRSGAMTAGEGSAPARAAPDP